MKKLFLILFAALSAQLLSAECKVYYAGSYATPYAYAWNASGNNHGWPGTAMTATSYTFNSKTIWEITFSVDYPNIIFNNNGSPQTADLLNECGSLYDEDGDRWVAYSGSGDVIDTTGVTPSEQGVVGVPAEYEGVMLQAFYWDSYRLDKYGRTKWLDLLRDTAAICDNFDLVWFPPSGNGGGVGYYTKTYSSQDSDWGSKAKLLELIGALHARGVKAIGDIVVNHRQSSSGWAKSFTPENFQGYGTWQITSEHICAGDEAFTSASSDSKNLPHGAADTGDNDGGCRDLDHTSQYVQDYIKAYLNWMRDSIGYDGWRYDMVKGYKGKYVSMYNLSSEPFLSVAEYWDGISALQTYLKSTDYNTMVFDFPLKYVLRDNLGKGKYTGLRNPANSLRSKGLSKYAVTFIDNHDTFERSDSKDNEYIAYNCDVHAAANHTKILQANAYLLSMPGVPCVFWPHFAAFPNEIRQLISVRKAAGVHSESAVTEESAGTDWYSATVEGHNGTLIVRLGAGRDLTAPAGFHQAADGDGYTLFLSDGLTPVENVEAAASSSRKIMIDGQLLIERDGVRYDALGRRVNK